jgi:hypothetical protein
MCAKLEITKQPPCDCVDGFILNALKQCAAPGCKPFRHMA